MKLKSGVHLNIQNCNQFKTVLIIIRFEAEIKKEILAKRALLSALFEKNNAQYPNNQQFEQQLDFLYGASFSTTIDKKGNTHCLSLNLKIINEKFVNDKQLIKEGINLLKTIIFQPNATNNAFDEATFQLEKKNLIQYAKSISDDNRYYAQNQLKAIFFNNADYALPTYSSIPLIEKETAQSVFTYYQKMLEEDRIEIFVNGAVNEAELIEQFEAFPFAKRDTKDSIFFIDEGVQSTIREKTEQKKANQSILNIGYYVPADISKKEYFPLQVFNGLFGGFSHSKLFTNIREESSLAYDISSSVDVLRHLLIVETGIQKENKMQVIKLINQQLNDLKKGKFSKKELEQTILMLENIYQQGSDSQKVMLERMYLSRKIPEILSKNEWLNALRQVKKEDVTQIAESLKLQVIYFMEGIE